MAVLVQVIKSVHKFITSFHTKINIQYKTSSQRTWIAILLLINNPAAAAILLVGKYFKSFHRLAWKKKNKIHITSGLVDLNFVTRKST